MSRRTRGQHQLQRQLLRAALAATSIGVAGMAAAQPAPPPVAPADTTDHPASATVAAAAAAKLPGPSYPMPTASWLSGIWGDGEGTMWAISGGSVEELQRGASRPCRHVTRIYAAVAVAGRGGGHDAEIAVLGRRGEIAVRLDGTFVELPEIGHTSTDVAFHRSGDVLVTTASHGLYRQHDGGWKVHAYPADFPAVSQIIALPDGASLLLAPGPRLLRFADDKLSEVTLDQQPANGSERPVKGWYQASGNALWLAWDGEEVLRVDLTSGRSTAKRMGLFGGAHALAGQDWGTPSNIPPTPTAGSDTPPAPTAEGPPANQPVSVVVAGQSDIGVWQNGSTTALGRLTFAEGAYLDAAERAVYLVSRDGMLRIGLPAAQGVAAAAALPMPSTPCGVAMTQADPDVEPATEPPNDEDELLEEDDDGIDWEPFPLPQLGVAMGPSFHIVSDADDDVAFTLDIEAGVKMFFVDATEAAFHVRPTLGYSLDTSEAFGGDRFIGGIGLGYGSVIASATLTPKFVFGSYGDVSSVPDFRYGLRGDVLAGLLSVETSHQMMWPVDDPRHEFRLTFGVDLVPLAGTVLAASILGDLL